MTHTPGPWIVSKWGDGSNLIGCTNIAAPESEVIIADDILVEDAHLIAAAPDLLEALEGLVDAPAHHPDYLPSKLWDAARAAIAKAKGQSNE